MKIRTRVMVALIAVMAVLIAGCGTNAPDSHARIASLTLVDAETQQAVPGHDPLSDGDVINVRNQSEGGFDIQANVGTAPVVRVDFSVSGPTSLDTRAGAPYQMLQNAQDGSPSMASWTPDVGTYLITATPIDGDGEHGAATTIEVVVVDQEDSTGRVEAAAPAEDAVVRINAGGSALTLNGVTWDGDQHFTGGVTYANDGIADIANTDDDEVYRTERAASSDGGSFAYEIPMADGTYRVRLHFAEIFFGAGGSIQRTSLSPMRGVGDQNDDPLTTQEAGDRVFDVNIEGGPVELSNYDISADVGPEAAVVIAYDVTLQDGVLDLAFTGSVNRPKISAIEIVPSDADAPADEEPTEEEPTEEEPTEEEPTEEEPTDEGPGDATGSVGDVVARINAGGPALTTGGVAWDGDMYFSRGVAYVNADIEDIANTSDDELYRTERSAGSDDGTFAYEIPVSDGAYRVRLHFAEIFFGAGGSIQRTTVTGLQGMGDLDHDPLSAQATGDRVFSVNLEGGTVELADYDISADVGAEAAAVKTFDVNVEDGVLDLDFSASENRPKISAIEVLRFDPDAPTEEEPTEEEPTEEEPTEEDPNQAPVAYDDQVETLEGTDVTVTLNGDDPDGDALDYRVVTQPTHGTLSGSAPNLTYAPNDGFTGADALTFTVDDGTVESDAATLDITVLEDDEPTGETPSGMVGIAPGTNIQRVIDDHPSGTSYYLHAGIHRYQSISPDAGDTLVGADGAILSGARELTSFQREGSLWYADGQTQYGGTRDRYPYKGMDICMERHTDVLKTPRCEYAEDLFFDDVMLTHVASKSDVEPGTWFFDYDADRIYFADDPSGHKVETSVTNDAAIEADGAGNVTLRNLIIEKYALHAQSAALRTGDGWLVEDTIVRHNHGIGVHVRNDVTLRNVRSHHNGQLGMRGIGDRYVIEDSEIDHNNVVGFATGWEAGATKFLRSEDVRISRTHVHDNYGPGLWFDWDNVGSVSEDNVLADNAGPGFLAESSYDLLIRNNVVEGNGYGRSVWLTGAGIVINTSTGVTITGNTVRDNLHGVALLQGKTSHEVDDVEVRGNVIDMPRGQSGMVVAGHLSDGMSYFDNDIQFSNNTYTFGGQDGPFAWEFENMSVNEWQSAGMDTNGSFQLFLAEGN